MLTVRDSEVLAYARDGVVRCYACTVKWAPAIHIARCEAGFDDGFEPLSRYALEESAVEIGWTEAEERLTRFLTDHPQLSARVFGPALNQRLQDVTFVLALAYGRESCEDCGVQLVLRAGARRRELERREAKLGRPLRWAET